MRKTNVGRLVAAGLALSTPLFMVAGCGSGGGTTSQPIVASTPTPSPSPTPEPLPTDGAVSVTGRYKDLSYTLSAPKQVYSASENAMLTLTIQNQGSADIADPNFTCTEASVAGGAFQTQGLSNVGTNFRLFPVGIIFRAGETVTLPIPYPLANYSVGTNHMVRILNDETASSGLASIYGPFPPTAPAIMLYVR